MSEDIYQAVNYLQVQFFMEILKTWIYTQFNLTLFITECSLIILSISQTHVTMQHLAFVRSVPVTERL